MSSVPAPNPPESSVDSFKAMGLTMPIALGFGVIALFFGGFLGWAALAPLGSAAIAPGVVSVETNRKTIQHLEGGIIGAIKVRMETTLRPGKYRWSSTRPNPALHWNSCVCGNWRQ